MWEQQHFNNTDGKGPHSLKPVSLFYIVAFFSVKYSVAGSFLLGIFRYQREVCSTPGSFRESVLIKRNENIVLNIAPKTGL